MERFTRWAASVVMTLALATLSVRSLPHEVPRPLIDARGVAVTSSTATPTVPPGATREPRSGSSVDRAPVEPLPSPTTGTPAEGPAAPAAPPSSEALPPPADVKRTPEGDEPAVLPPSTFDLVPMRFEMTPSTYHLYDGELLTVTTRVCSEGDRPARFTSMYPDFFEYSIVDSGQGFQFFTHVSGALDEDFEFVVPPGDCVEERYTWDRHQNFEPFAEAPPGYYHFWGGAHVRQEGDPGDAQPLGGAFWFQLHAGTRPADGGETAPFPADFDPPNKWTFHASVRGDRFVVGEPVHVDVQVCNQTDTAGRLLAVEGDDFPGHLQVEFRRDDGTEHFARLETMRYPAGQPTPAYEIPLPPRGCTSWVVTWNGTAGRFTDDMTGVDLVPPGNYRVGVSMFQPLPREQFAPQSHGFVTEIALVGA